MSSTNRGGQREVSDYYITPHDHIRMFMVEFLDDLIEDKDPIMAPGRGINVLDPCAGGDGNNPMAYPTVLAEWGDMFDVNTIDIREDSRAEFKACDYLKYNISINRPDLIITNPPFSLAEPIIEKAIGDVAPGGYVVMLLRLNFLGSKKRSAFFKKYILHSVYVHSRRMSFTPNGKTDSIEYGHFVWQKGNAPEFAGLKILDFKETAMMGDKLCLRPAKQRK